MIQTGKIAAALKVIAIGSVVLAVTESGSAQYPKFCPEMQSVHAGGAGPSYTYEMGKYEMTNAQFAEFLNDAELTNSFSPADPRCAFMEFDPLVGHVGLVAGGTELFDIAQSRLTYDPAAVAGCRYGIQPGFQNHPATGMTWIGAVKLCNWLTIDQGLPTLERCYTEGPVTNDWHPVTISTAAWLLRDLNDAERLALLGLEGYRLAMDSSGAATGWLNNPENGYNEWYKAAAYDPGAPGLGRIGPGGSTVSAFHWIYGFGRDAIGGADADYSGSGDPFELAGFTTTPVGFYDGTLYNPDGTPDEDQSPDDPADFQTIANDNQYGFFDLSGNVSEWGQDQPLITGRVYHGGSWNDASDVLAANWRDTAGPTDASDSRGLRVVRVVASADCNANGMDDHIDILGGTSTDCNTNGVPDECDFDCNTNAVPDACDIDPADPDGDGFIFDDLNGNGIPDECEPPWSPTQACCLPLGACVDTDPITCLGLSGTPMGTGSECRGDVDSSGTDDACEPLAVVQGLDEFVTPPDGATYDFCSSPIPREFFGPGSLPFEGLVHFGEGNPDPADTIMNRGPLNFSPAYPSAASTALNLECMHVYSCEPVIVQYQGGGAELWEVQMLASGLSGSLDAELKQGLYGEFTAQFEVNPRFVFTRVGSNCDACPPPGSRCNACFDPDCLPPQCPGLTDCCPQGANCPPDVGTCPTAGIDCCRELETSSCGFPPMWMQSARPTGFKIERNDNGTPANPNDDFNEFEPGVTKDGAVAPDCCEPICHAAAPPLPGTPPIEGHMHCVNQFNCPECEMGACCNAAVGCEMTSGPQNCNGEFKGLGTDCSDDDGDAIPDVMEVADCCLPDDDACNVRTDPNLPDTDGDGCLDGDEFSQGTDPCDPCDYPPGCGPPANDCNTNGIPDECEPDCDCDGVPDACESDSDSDGTVDDCDGCPNEPALTSPSETPETTCADGVDNDCDGTTDGSDSDCTAASCPHTCGDIDGSGGTVNLVDFATFALCFGQSPSLSVGCRCSDLNGDGSINLVDFATFSLTFSGVSTNVPPNCP